GECARPLAAAIVCTNCGASNPRTQKFCNGCAAPLSDAAMATALREPRTYTPKHLAEKIRTARSALEGERKQVTVLFADVKGSMELGEKVDPEDRHRIMDRFFAVLSEGVHRFEGTINQYTGDGIMALFGAPMRSKTMRGSPVPAVLAGGELARLRALGLSVALRALRPHDGARGGEKDDL